MPERCGSIHQLTGGLSCFNKGGCLSLRCRPKEAALEPGPGCCLFRWVFQCQACMEGRAGPGQSPRPVRCTCCLTAHGPCGSLCRIDSARGAPEPTRAFCSLGNWA